jgi:hypothetical protein
MQNSEYRVGLELQIDRLLPLLAGLRPLLALSPLTELTP